MQKLSRVIRALVVLAVVLPSMPAWAGGSVSAGGELHLKGLNDRVCARQNARRGMGVVGFDEFPCNFYPLTAGASVQAEYQASSNASVGGRVQLDLWRWLTFDPLFTVRASPVDRMWVAIDFSAGPAVDLRYAEVRVHARTTAHLGFDAGSLQVFAEVFAGRMPTLVVIGVGTGAYLNRL